MIKHNLCLVALDDIIRTDIKDDEIMKIMILCVMILSIFLLGWVVHKVLIDGHGKHDHWPFQVHCGRDTINLWLSLVLQKINNHYGGIQQRLSLLSLLIFLFSKKITMMGHCGMWLIDWDVHSSQCQLFLSMIISHFLFKRQINQVFFLLRG